MAYQGSSGPESRLYIPLILQLMQPPAAAGSSRLPSRPGSSSGARAKGAAQPEDGAAAASPAAVAAAGARGAFAAGWRGVPLKALLPWLSQMLSRLGEEEGAVLAAPLEELARRWGPGFGVGWIWSSCACDLTRLRSQY
jgi:hypothetical protein